MGMCGLTSLVADSRKQLKLIRKEENVWEVMFLPRRETFKYCLKVCDLYVNVEEFAFFSFGEATDY